MLDDDLAVKPHELVTHNVCVCVCVCVCACAPCELHQPTEVSNACRDEFVVKPHDLLTHILCAGELHVRMDVCSTC